MLEYTQKVTVKTSFRKFRIGKGGTSYTTTLPKDWVLQYTKNTDTHVRMDQVGETLFINPVKKEKDEKPLKIVIGKDSEKAYYSVISAYIQNYDKIILTEDLHDEKLIDKLRVIDSKLPGSHFYPQDEEGSYLVKFDNNVTNIPQLIDDMFEEYRVLYTKNIEMFQGSTKTEKIDVKSNFVELKEESVDKQFFHLKRLFTNVFENILKEPEILATTGLMSKDAEFDYSVVAKTVGYSSIANSLERLTDLQVDIFKNLKKIIIDDKNKSCLMDKEAKYGFEKFYSDANMMLEDSYNSKKIMGSGSEIDEGFQCLLKVLKAEENKKEQKNNGPKFREGYIKKEDMETIRKLAGKDPHLTNLEGQIWGSTGIATNIAETWINMSDLETIKGNSDYFVKKKK